MKIAVSSSGDSLSGDIAGVFGRCPHFIIVEIVENKAKILEIAKNPGAEQKSGAGITAAKLIAEKEADAVIAKSIGPRAMDILKQFDIKVFEAEGGISQALENFIEKNPQ